MLTSPVFARIAKYRKNTEIKCRKGTMNMSHADTIGEKIKTVRTSQNLTLKQLSEMTGLSTGFLSQLERGLSSIAVDSLELIANALNVNLAAFFDSYSEKNDEPVMYSFSQRYNQTASKIFQAVLNHDVSSFAMLPRLTQLMPQANLDEEELEMYNHKGEEFIYVLEGTVTLLLDSQRYTLNPGDCVQFPSNKDHNWMNCTNKIVKLLTVNIPSPFYEEKE